MWCDGGGSRVLFLERESFRMDSFIGFFFDSFDVPVGRVASVTSFALGGFRIDA